jgi:hypothetical protein
MLLTPGEYRGTGPVSPHSPQDKTLMFSGGPTNGLRDRVLKAVMETNGDYNIASLGVLPGSGQRQSVSRQSVFKSSKTRGFFTESGRRNASPGRQENGRKPLPTNRRHQHRFGRVTGSSNAMWDSVGAEPRSCGAGPQPRLPGDSSVACYGFATSPAFVDWGVGHLGRFMPGHVDVEGSKWDFGPLRTFTTRVLYKA